MVRKLKRRESKGNRADLDVHHNVLEDILTAGPKPIKFKPVTQQEMERILASGTMHLKKHKVNEENVEKLRIKEWTKHLTTVRFNK